MIFHSAMYLLVLNTQPAGGAGHSMLVWVEAADVAQAETRALELAQRERWAVASVESALETRADDYFRACPSQQAFERAQRDGIAWRVSATEADTDEPCLASPG